VLFSHGLGGSRKGGGFLGNHWAARGYVAVFLQHPGSDESVWRDVPAQRRLAAMRDAASLENLRVRVHDVSAVLDALATWNGSPGHPLAGRLDLDRIGMSGHSFGAQTTQAVSGQSFPVVGRRSTDPRIKAAVIMSPGTPRGRRDPGDAFAEVTIPWLLLTGTKDTSLIGSQTVESRLAVYPALPAGSAYELVLHDAEHSAFSDRALPGDREPRNPNHHRAILALTTAFWDAFLRENDDARAWLDGDGPRQVLEADDRWQRK
jgi:predicted dienelactone hydrolase